jgi:molybdate transport system regulatory protein
LNRDIEALLTWRSQGRTSIGRERVAMLEAVAAQGSITAAAKALGLSYKTVWDGIDAINNLLPRPALIAQTGGRGGGGATLTQDGRKLIVSFHRLEEKLSQITATLNEESEFHPDLLFWSVAVKTSARNAFRCRVAALDKEAVAVTVTLEIAAGRSLTAIITNDSAEDLGLAPGLEVLALIKASFVTFDAAAQANRFAGTVIKRTDGERDAEIVLDIGDGKTLTAVVPRDGVHLQPGDATVAGFSPSQVILAVG